MTSLNIHVESDTLVLRGSVEESTGCVLRGCLTLQVKEATKIKSITMRLQGRMKAFWIERVHDGPIQHKRTQRQEITVYEHDWVYLAPGKKTHTLDAGTYRYPFELVMDGRLPETINLRSCGSLIYKLKATCERGAFSPNIIARKALNVTRGDQSFRLSYPVHIANEWSDRLDYSVYIAKSVYAPGETIAIRFKAKLKSNDLRFRRLSGFLKEYATVSIGGEAHAANSKIIRYFRNDHFPSTVADWEKEEVITIPQLEGLVQCHTKNDYFKVHHQLKFTLSLINPQGKISDLRLSVPIYIEQEDCNELPTYENAWRTVLYSPNDLSTPPMLLCSPNYSEHTDVDPLSPASDVLQDQPSLCGDDYFSYQPISCLTRLPSYRTAMRDTTQLVDMDRSTLPAYCA